jgi:preprotein translocase subunit SecD
MARRSSRPGRSLVLFLLSLAAITGLVALTSNWTPRLGLDLQGGTRITVRAESEGLTQEKLAEARDIVDNRVNGTGVTEAEVTLSGENVLIVEVPGDSVPELEQTITREALMRFRLVAQSDLGEATVPLSNSPTPGSGVVVPNPSDSASGGAGPSVGSSPDPKAPALNKPLTGASPSASADNNGANNNGANNSQGASSKPTAKPSGTKKPSGDPSPDEAPSGSPSDSAPIDPGTDPNAPKVSAAVAKQLAWQENPDPASVVAFNKYTCPASGQDEKLEDDPAKPLITCDQDGVKYLLSPSLIEGTDLNSAEVLTPGTQGNVEWGVTLDLGGKGKDVFSEVTRSIVGTGQTFAIVLDGQVLSAPQVTSAILDGNAQITGNFTEESALSLATSLRFGALPIQFSDDTVNEVVGPSLAGNQLAAGLWAGGLGLLLVMIYCLIYYRGLGVVVLLSLAAAAGSTYLFVLLLSEAAGFTLSLPGIAGLIVAVGITADSFVVFFERIRDEMREGKSMKVAVESGWERAWRTCVAADAVSLLAALVLYIFAAGVVKGFAFALGLSTLIDLGVFYFFTKPLVSWLAQFSFFNSGHKLSGLSPETMGIAEEGRLA